MDNLTAEEMARLRFREYLQHLRDIAHENAKGVTVQPIMEKVWDPDYPIVILTD